MKSKVSIYLFAYILIFLFSFETRSQEIERKDLVKKKLKIETPLPSERVLMPSIDSEEKSKIILIPPKEVLEAIRKKKEEKERLRLDAIKKAEEEKERLRLDAIKKAE